MADDDLSAEEQEALDSAGEELDAQDSSDETSAEIGSSPALSLHDGEGGTEAAESGWQQKLQDAGFQTFDDVDNAVDALVESNRQRDGQIQHYAEQLKFYQDQLQSREQHSSAPVEQAPARPSGVLDEIVDNWEDPSFANQYIEVDEDGNRFISESADEETKSRILNADKKLKKWQEVLQDPRSFAEAIDQRVDAMIADRFESNYEQKQTQAQESRSIDNFVSSNAEWLYVKDPATGQYVTDARSGQFVYSDAGNQFLGHMNSVAQDGVTSVPSQIRYASMAMGVGTGGGGSVSGSGSPPSTEAMAANQRAAMRGRSNTSRGRQTSFNGVNTESASSPTGRNQMSFGEETLAAMKSSE